MRKHNQTLTLGALHYKAHFRFLSKLMDFKCAYGPKNTVCSSPKVCAICTRLLWYSKRHLRKRLLPYWAALFQGWMNFTPLFVFSFYPRCATFQELNWSTTGLENS